MIRRALMASGGVYPRRDKPGGSPAAPKRNNSTTETEEGQSMEVLLFLSCLVGQVPGNEHPVIVAPPHSDDAPIGTLWARDGSFGGIPYIPHEGDLLLVDSVEPIYTLTFPLARTWHPFHSILIVRRTTGDLSCFENGGDYHPYAALRPPAERLPDWMKKWYWRPRIFVRRIKQPPTVEESRELTAFVETQAYKPFVRNRTFLLFFIPGRPLPPTSPAKQRWFCSEMLAEAMVASGLRTAAQIPRPETITPHDLLVDCRLVLSDRWEAPLVYSATDQPPPPGPPLGPR
jgi:hypothetical protein